MTHNHTPNESKPLCHTSQQAKVTLTAQQSTHARWPLYHFFFLFPIGYHKMKMKKTKKINIHFISALCHAVIGWM